ncbi:hypothetical protein JOD57_002709 [Geodermatophilus bullaregiensis]|uniref:hypothetical protein n=1 Tax=Geodermatophilus bullaregiensis TaxID=1564160 RepID=UPI00195CCDA4|nr:hypothetical protein [Geodermatophilus bullaregiensis]MBM7806872.1 hypothetical protein [Geodermatophilus bullaregiensis]
MTLQRPEFQQLDLDMEQVRVRIGDDEVLVSWHPPDRPPDGQRHGAEDTRVTDSGEVVVGRNGRCWQFPAGRPETEPELPS